MRRTHQIIIWLIGLLAVGTFLFGVWQLVGAWTGTEISPVDPAMAERPNATAAEGNKLHEREDSNASKPRGETKTNFP